MLTRERRSEIRALYDMAVRARARNAGATPVFDALRDLLADCERLTVAMERLASREAFCIAIDLDWESRDPTKRALLDELVARLEFANSVLIAASVSREAAQK